MRSRRPAKQCVRSREPQNGPRPADAASVLDPATSPPRRPITLGPEGPSYLARRARHRRRIGRGTRRPEKVHPADGERRQDGVPLKDPRTPTRHHRRRAEFPGSTLRIHPFDSMRFHVLLNSLFKVLFNFPSRYLSAIGLVPVFSLRWSLPPALGCIPKQPDSEEARSRRVSRRKGLTPALGKATIRRTWALDAGDNRPPIHHISRRPNGREIRCWALPASLAVTEGILVSFFSSAY